MSSHMVLAGSSGSPLRFRVSGLGAVDGFRGRVLQAWPVLQEPFLSSSRPASELI